MFAEQRLSGCNPLVIRRVTEDSCKCIIFRDALRFFESDSHSFISLIISTPNSPIVIVLRTPIFRVIGAVVRW